ncbi:YHS domain-containing (seleno)protein [Hydrogenophaga sp.]|uniref:YHS domain-containing (seleno)protein n=1 Tax=Hydrogenophaga sp. TaxID=1904254 RepID=UPI002B835DF7|nr:YHS domain-containing (seleno)protein [Hydrogenophaga sp.]HMP11698.1 YHS domain-containing (seleno)protein [Hydrogenophaga sp.]
MTSTPQPPSSPVRRILVTATLAVAALGLAGCGAMKAQNPSGSLKPVNAVAMAPDARVMLAGADVVAYFTEGRHRQGSPGFRSEYEGVVFHFASAEHKTLFDAEPARYLPQFGGYCTNGIVYAIPWGGDADSWLMIDGQLYIFGGQASKEAFELDVPGNLALAEKYWNEEVRGRNSFIQRAQRLVFKVPHYQTGEQLAKAVAEARARNP